MIRRVGGGRIGLEGACESSERHQNCKKQSKQFLAKFCFHNFYLRENFKHNEVLFIECSHTDSLTYGQSEQSGSVRCGAPNVNRCLQKRILLHSLNIKTQGNKKVNTNKVETNFSAVFTKLQVRFCAN